MGLVNNIGTEKDIKCLRCKKSLRYDTEYPVYKGIKNLGEYKY